VTDELFQTGDRVRREVLGDAHVNRGGPEFSAPFRAYVTRTAWGQVWSRPGLDRRTRSCVTIAVLAALHCETELALHVEAALRNGVTPEEIQEVLLHTAVYAGAPAANSAFAVAARVIEESA
jgi:4-carboxymuconolactone decarboxylase